MFCEGLYSFNWKDSVTNIHGLAFLWRRFVLHRTDLWKTLIDSYFFSRPAWLTSWFYLFFFYLSLSSSSWTLFDNISSNIDLDQPICWCTVSGDFSVHQKDWLPYFRGTDNLVNSCNFFLSNDFTQMVNFST